MTALWWAVPMAALCTGLIVALKPYGVAWRDYRDMLVQERVAWAVCGGVFLVLLGFFALSNNLAGVR